MKFYRTIAYQQIGEQGSRLNGLRKVPKVRKAPKVLPVINASLEVKIVNFIPNRQVALGLTGWRVQVIGQHLA